MYSDPGSLNRTDFTAAIIVHIVVVGVLFALASWFPHSAPVIPRAVEVRLIPLSQLQQAKPKPKPKPKPAPKVEKPKPKPKPKAKPKPEAKPKPKPKAKPKPKPKPKPQMNEEDFFSPLTSSRQAAEPVPPPPLKSKREPEPTPEPAPPIARAQPLSQREIDHYIAAIQGEIQRNWNVPANLSGNLVDPVVVMDLNVDGSVRRLEIDISSGSPALDQSLLRAIEKAQPFVIPARSFDPFRSNRMRFHPLR